MDGTEFRAVGLFGNMPIDPEAAVALNTYREARDALNRLVDRRRDESSYHMKAAGVCDWSANLVAREASEHMPPVHEDPGPPRRAA